MTKKEKKKLLKEFEKFNEIVKCRIFASEIPQSEKDKKMAESNKIFENLVQRLETLCPSNTKSIK